MLASSRDDLVPLLGREPEQELLGSLLDEIGSHGRALVLRGPPGVGKSRLLADTARIAHGRGITVLTTTGVESETNLPFAGLHQLLRPVRARAVDLPPLQRRALDAAFGLIPEAAPEHFQIAMAALDLLSDVAGDGSLLIVIEDAHWLDHPTADVLAFIGRRIESDPIVLLAATRDGYSSALGDGGLPEHRLSGLDNGTAGRLLDAVAPDLSSAARARVLQEAEGNPLALIELPQVARQSQQAAFGLGPLPLTKTLERGFASRISELPDDTRLLLLIAAVDDSNRLSEILSAASLVTGRGLELDALEPAAHTGLIDVDLQTLRFSHPLIRSAVAQSAPLGDRRRAHEALVDVLADQPDRRVWHRAALLSRTDEEVAGELEAAAHRARRRGAAAVAVAALGRAAELSEGDGRSRRTLEAAQLAVEVGRRDLVVPLLREAEALHLDDLGQARLAWLEEVAQTRPFGDPTQLRRLLAAAEQAAAAGDLDLQLDVLWLVASRAWWVDPGPDARQALIEAAHGVGSADAEDPRGLAVHAYADPVGHSEGVLARLRQEAAHPRSDPHAARFFGPAALVVGAFDLGYDFLEIATTRLREDGRLGPLPRLLSLYSTMAARLGNWEVAIAAGEEAKRLATEFDEPHWQAAADTVISLVAAMRGDEALAIQLADQAEAVAGPRGANITMAFAQFGRVLAALATGDYPAAYTSAERLFDPADSAYHPGISSWLIADLADAAVHLNELEPARARVAQVEAISAERAGAWTALALNHARALIADPADAADRFEEALATDLTRWPFQRARIQLAYGQWLRRQRKVGESRTVLRASRDTFEALGCQRWSEHARRELRASGERSRRPLPEARDQLTAQELQITQLAAQGLSNREIGQRLYLSHRTVSTHLYRVFPKLGISSRSELTDALAPRATATGDVA